METNSHNKMKAYQQKSKQQSKSKRSKHRFEEDYGLSDVVDVVVYLLPSLLIIEISFIGVFLGNYLVKTYHLILVGTIVMVISAIPIVIMAFKMIRLMEK